VKRYWRLVNPFCPPFRGLMAIVWLYFVLCFCLHPASPIRNGQLIDPDDAMYLVQTLNLLDGQGWYDRVEHRLDPPEGVQIHFSRLMELPYAALIGPLRPLLGRVHAALFAASVVPPLFLLGLLFILRWQAQCVLPRSWGAMTAFTVLFAQKVTFEFMPGRVGHHGAVLLLVALVTAFLSRLVLNPAERRWAIGAGAALALSVALALETLPWLLVISIAFGVWAVLQGGEARARSGLYFGVTLALVGAFLLMTYRSPGDVLTPDLVSYSCVYVLLLSGIALCFGAVWRVRRWENVWARIGVVSLVALLSGGGFLAVFPQLLGGPYGAVDPAFVKVFLSDIIQAIPFGQIDVVIFILYFLPWPLLSFGTCLWQMVYSINSRRWLWGFFALLQMTGFLLAVAYQFRYADYAQLFGIIPLTVLLHSGLRDDRVRENGRRIGGPKDLAFIVPRVILVALLPLLSIGLYVMVHGATATDLALFQMRAFAHPCDVGAAADILNRPPYNQGPPKLIMNGINEGTDLLLRTPDAILSAPYHTNIRGNLDALAFFRATDAQTAESIARRRGAAFVLSCRDIETTYLPDEGVSASSQSSYPPVPPSPPFAVQLTGSEIPAWLIPIQPGRLGHILLFQIRPELPPP